MPIYMTAQYQVHPNQVEKTKESARQLVKHVKTSEPFTTIYIAQQENIEPIKVHAYFEV